MDYIVGVSQGRAMFVLIAPLGVSSPALTYEVRSPCERGDLLQIPLKGKQILGVMLEEQTQPIDFACKLACESGYAFLPTQKLLAEFIARMQKYIELLELQLKDRNTMGIGGER